MEPESSGASGRLQLKATAWVNMGFKCTGSERQRVVSGHNTPKAGLADLKAIQCGGKEFSAKLGWDWVSKYIT